MIRFEQVSEDIYNRQASWWYESVLRVDSRVDATTLRTSRPDEGHPIVRVQIRRNAYQDQSFATLDIWTPTGWAKHTGIPAAEWWDDGPSHTTPVLTDPESTDVFKYLREELLRRYGHAVWGDLDARVITITKGE